MNTSLKRKTVLLVGDRYFIQNELAEFFQVHGYSVVSVGSAKEEIAAGISMKPELILVDYEMGHNDPYLVTTIFHMALPASMIGIMNGNLRHCDSDHAKSAGAAKVLNRSCEASAFNEVVHDSEEQVLF
ncbi:MAG: hypothetical protein ACHQM6_07405 [Candidatus Kapaibacterium sp.]